MYAEDNSSANIDSRRSRLVKGHDPSHVPVADRSGDERSEFFAAFALEAVYTPASLKRILGTNVLPTNALHPCDLVTNGDSGHER